jgi:hypothetical protein
MRNAFVVRRRKTLRDLDCVVDRLPKRQWPFGDQIAQRTTLEQFRNEVKRTVLTPNTEYGEDVRMRELGDRACFSLEARQTIWVVRPGWG